MSSSEILEGNKLIAQFNGMYCLNEYARYEGGTGIFYQDMRYNYYWDWIMPVVEKIQSLGFKFIIGTLHRVTVYNKDYEWRNGSTSDTLIECVWHGVTQFIKWYNQQSK